MIKDEFHPWKDKSKQNSYKMFHLFCNIATQVSLSFFQTHV
jgi:hypothetical protein